MNAARTLLVLGVLLGLCRFTPAAAQSPHPARPGEVILKFKGNATPAERAAILEELGAREVKLLPRIAAHHSKLATLSVVDAVQRYRNHPKLEFIEPNYLYRISAVPNDPRFSELWAMRNDGQTGGFPGADISATFAWDIITGSPSVRVGITDTGVDYTHPDLADNIFVNAGEIAGNGLDDDANGFIDDVRGWDFINHDNDPRDDNGHGTHVSGTVAGVGNNGVGVVGVAWRASIVPLKFLDAFGFGSTTDAVNAIDYAARMGVRVINASWGGGGPSEALRLSIQSAGDSGVVFVAAAGNSGLNNDIFPTYPASFDLPNIIAVAATNDRDELASFSNYGATSVHLGAPGVDILSTLPFTSYGVNSGTSMASPHVSGTLALIFSRFPTMTPVEAKELLLERVELIPTLEGRVLTGGRLNAAFALADPDSIPPGPINGLVAAQVQGSRVTLRWIATGDDGATGTATRYEVRYYPAPFVDVEFPFATLAPNPPRPGPAGSSEEMQIEDLDFSTEYFFALKAYDEFGNASPLSDIISATTLGPPDIAVEPSSLAADLFTGQQTTQSLIVSNTGVSELNLRINVRSLASPDSGAAQSALVPRVIGTFPVVQAPPAGAPQPEQPLLGAGTVAAVGSGNDSPAGYPIHTTPYAQGPGPRPPLTPADIRTGGVLAGTMRLLLLTSGADVSEIRTLLASFPDVSAVDVFDGLTSVPPLTLLAGYDAVIVVVNEAFGNPFATGDMLADYVDQGGGVVLTLASFINGWDIRGRFASGGYMPYNLGSGPIGGASLGTFDASHPIMAGVTHAIGQILGAVTLHPESELVASWDNGQPFVATRGRVVGANVFVGFTGNWAGDVPLVLHNAAAWSGGSAWLTADPSTGVIPAGGQLGVIVTFDAAGLDGGDYTASLTVESDDPDEGNVVVPVSLHVTGVPDIAVAGDLVVVESVQDFVTSGATTQHALNVPSLPPGSGVLELLGDGDFGFFPEIATLTVEGDSVGSTMPVGQDCAPARARFPIEGSRLSAWVADGVIQAQVVNNLAVDVFCPVNRHTLRLEYATPVDRLDFGGVFVGLSRELGVRVTNAGTDLLTVSSIAAAGAGFSASPSSLTIPSGATERIVVTFLAQAPQSYSGTLTLQTNDPDEGQLIIPLLGEGLVPPEVATTPTAFDETLLTGGTLERALSIANHGGSDLTFGITLEGGADAIVIPPDLPWPGEPLQAVEGGVAATGNGHGLEHGVPRSDSAAAHGQPFLPPSIMSNSTVLLVQDVQPWGTMANEALLQLHGISFDVVPTTVLPSINLLRYQKVIIAGDQPTDAYVRLAGQAGQLADYAAAGGVLQVHAAGWGTSGGDASLLVLPGGMGLAQDSRSVNYVVASGHPLMADVPNPILGTRSSHGFFFNLPAGGTLTTDEFSRPTMVAYAWGLGTVIASTHPLEYSYVAVLPPGIILRNMIPYGFVAASRWLSASPLTGRVPAGSAADVSVRLDARGLFGGDYHADLVLRTNDPDEAQLRLPVRLHVDVAPDLEIQGAPVMASSSRTYSSDGALTAHPLGVEPPVQGAATLEVEVDGDYGDFFETATVTVEGMRLGEVGRTGSDCMIGRGTFPISAADFARIAADSVVVVEMQNTFDVGVFCFTNEHRVALRHFRSVDPTDLGSVFVGACGSEVVVVANAGTAPLNVSSMSVTGAGFQIPDSAFSLEPGARRELTVTFCPLSPGVVNGTLEIVSDDPDEGVTRVALRAEGLIPPDVAVAPAQFDEALLSGQSVTRILTLDNLGGSALTFEIFVEAAEPDSQPVPAAAGRAGPVASSFAPVTATALRQTHERRTAASATTAEEDPSDARGERTMTSPGELERDPPRPDQTPVQYQWVPEPPSTMDGAMVLLIQDAPPWSTASNQQVLQANGIAFDIRPSSAVPSLDLSAYRKVIVASDQPTTTYDRLDQRAAQFATYVDRGGTLEFHGAWGWQQGDLDGFTLPGGTRIWHGLAMVNNVIDPDHPLAAGMPSSFPGFGASHVYFTNFPPHAETIMTDDQGRMTLIVYPFGRGRVIATGQPIEWGVAYGDIVGQILHNMIPFGFGASVSWVAVIPDRGQVAASGRADIAVTFDATGLNTGDFAADLVVRSDDPDESELRIPLRLHVTGVPDIVLSGDVVSVASAQPVLFPGATTAHALPITIAPVAGGEIELIAEGDYGEFLEVATASAEGMNLGQVGRTGLDCLAARDTFPIAPADLARLVADGVVQVSVRNAIDVEPICPLNEHRVVLRYRSAADLLDFGTVFVGSCREQSVEVANAGTEVLNVTSIEVAPGFHASPVSFSLPPGGRQEVLLSFCPLTAGSVEGPLRVRSDDPDEPELVFLLRGEGRVPPEIAVAPTELGEALLVGQTSSQRLRIANHGGSDLSFRIAVTADSLPDTTGVAMLASALSAEQGAAARARYLAYASQSPDAGSVSRSDGTAIAAAPRPGAPTTSLQPGSHAHPHAVTIFFDDMESGVNGWSHYPTDSLIRIDQWVQTTLRSSSGLRSWNVSQHPIMGSDALQSPVIDLSGHMQAMLSFRHFYDFDDCGGDPSFEPDGAVVEVSEIGTNLWQRIHPVDGYPYVLDDICQNPLARSEAYSHFSSGFVTATFDLTPFAGKQILIRFHAGWDCGNCLFNEGWFVDDVHVFSESPPWVAVSPREGVVPPGEVMEVMVGFDASGLEPGEYAARLRISSDDLDEPSLDVPVRLLVADLPATLDMNPTTINLGRRGQSATGYLELSGGLDPTTVDLATVRLNQVAPADPVLRLGDEDQDGIQDLTVKFPFDDVRPTLTPGDPVYVKVTGHFAGGIFLAVDSARVLRHELLSPQGGEVFAPGTSVSIVWSVPQEWPPNLTADLHWSWDAGVTWTPIAIGVQGTSYAWTVPAKKTSHAVVRVDMRDDQGVLDSDASNAFTITESVTAAGEPRPGWMGGGLRFAPNPFGRGGTQIGFALAAPGEVELAIYSAAGRRVRTLLREWRAAGLHQVRWDGRDQEGATAGSGIYFCRLRAPGLVQTKRMSLVR